mmetsp:Transcript_21250/g.72375  ORF Transcript_21250/g.72375 Transcript_21250/m.72375 type:complete len:227 (+) Transcript_21250:414-1094(+)
MSVAAAAAAAHGSTTAAVAAAWAGPERWASPPSTSALTLRLAVLAARGRMSVRLSAVPACAAMTAALGGKVRRSMFGRVRSRSSRYPPTPIARLSAAAAPSERLSTLARRLGVGRASSLKSGRTYMWQLKAKRRMGSGCTMTSCADPATRTTDPAGSLAKHRSVPPPPPPGRHASPSLSATRPASATTSRKEARDVHRRRSRLRWAERGSTAAALTAASSAARNSA